MRFSLSSCSPVSARIFFRLLLLALASLSWAAPARADTFYVSLVGNNSIEEFAPDGTDLGAFPATGLNGPYGLTFDSAGILYVVNSDLNTIEKFSPAGVNLGTFAKTGLNGPISIIFDSNGNLYATNSYSDTVEKFSPAGVDLGVFANLGLDSQPWGLAFDSGGNLYVSCKGSNNIQEISPSGARLGVFASANVSSPTGLAFDRNGNLYVANQVGSPPVIQIYSPAGVNIGQINDSGLSLPCGLMFDSSGNLYVCISATNKIDRISATHVAIPFISTALGTNPTFILDFPGPTAPRITADPASQAIDSGQSVSFSASATGSGLSYQWQKNGVNLSDAGNISGANASTLRISAVTGNDFGQYRVVISNMGGAVTSLPANLTVFASLPVPPGTLFVSCYSQNSIEAFAPDGTAYGTLPLTGLDGPQGLAFDAQGYLYVVNSLNNTVEKFSPDGDDLGAYINFGLSMPVSIAFDRADNAYVTSYASGSVLKYSPTGGLPASIGYGVSVPWGVAFDSAGNLFVGSQWGDNIEEFSSTGAILGVFASSNIFAPTGLAFDPAGNLYVANQLRNPNTVQIYSPAGDNLGQVAVTGLNQPCGLFFDSGGNLFICDSANDQIRKVSPNGVDLGIFAHTGNNTSPVMIAAVPPPLAANIVGQPAPFTVVLGATATFTVVPEGIPAPTLQWQISWDDGATWANLTDGGNISGSTTSVLALAKTTFAMSGQQFRVTIINPLGSAVSSPVALSVVIPPKITSPPSNTFFFSGSNVTFSANATGFPAPNYQWFFNGNPVSASTPSANFTIVHAGRANLGKYTVVVSNGVGKTVISAPAVLAFGVSPKISIQPSSLTIAAGQDAPFFVVASGLPAPSFQWQVSVHGTNSWINLSDNASYSGTATASLFVNNPDVGQSNNQFRVIISCLIGSNVSVTSRPAILTVLLPPDITDLSAGNLSSLSGGNMSIVAGTNLIFSVTAIANGVKLKYQWQHNGKNIPGATKPSYTLSTAAAAADGTYDVVVTNASVSSTSAIFTLNILTKPTLITQPKPQTAKAGATASFSVVPAGNPPPTLQWKRSGINLADGPDPLFPGVNLSGTANTTLTLGNVTSALSGTLYQVTLSNSQGNLTSSAVKFTLKK